MAWGSGGEGVMEVGAPGPVLFCTLDACGYQVASVGRVVVSGESAERRLAGDHARNGMGRIAALPCFCARPLGSPNLYKSAMTLRVRCAPLVRPFPLA